MQKGEIMIKPLEAYQLSVDVESNKIKNYEENNKSELDFIESEIIKATKQGEYSVAINGAAVKDINDVMLYMNMTGFYASCYNFVIYISWEIHD